jgi:hypothetical protein
MSGRVFALRKERGPICASLIALKNKFDLKKCISKNGFFTLIAMDTLL